MAQTMLDEYQSDMIGRGIASDHIEGTTQARRLGFAKDIIEFAQQGRFDAIGGRKSVGKAIMDFSEKGDYRTLVVGRRGIDRSFFMGSVSRYMINNLSDGAVWVIP